MPNRILRPWVDSEAVNSLSDAAEVFFVRLIQCADDYGRFYGTPMLLKSYLFPLKDKRVADISRWIAECVKAGLIADYEVSGKRFVEIRKFNQRLRLKGESKFPAPPDGGPSNDRQMTVMCQSCDGQMTARSEKRETRDEKKTVADATAKETAVSFDLFEFPDSLNFPEFREKWQEWLDYRKSKRKPVSPIAAKKQIATLSQYDLPTALAMIDESIRNDWTGIFPPKPTVNATSRYRKLQERTGILTESPKFKPDERGAKR